MQGRSIGECQEAVSSLEFMDWIVYMEQVRWDRRDKQDYYLAQIVAEIRSLFSKSRVSVESCMLTPDYTGKPAVPKKEPLDLDKVASGEIELPDAWKKVTEEAKQVWTQRLGLNPDGTVKTQEPPNGNGNRTGT